MKAAKDFWAFLTKPDVYWRLFALLLAIVLWLLAAGDGSLGEEERTVTLQVQTLNLPGELVLVDGRPPARGRVFLAQDAQIAQLRARAQVDAVAQDGIADVGEVGRGGVGQEEGVLGLAGVAQDGSVEHYHVLAHVGPVAHHRAAADVGRADDVGPRFHHRPCLNDDRRVAQPRAAHHRAVDAPAAGRQPRYVALQPG